jgi:hypothetical protein
LIRAALAGLGEDSMLTVVGGLEFDGWDVAACLEQAPMSLCRELVHAATNRVYRLP